LFKTIKNIFIRIKGVRLSARNNKKRADFRGLSRNPLFYFGSISAVLFFSLYVSCGDNSINIGLVNSQAFFSRDYGESNVISSLFSSPANAIPLETPDLKIIQNNTLGGVSTPSVVSGKVLGDTFGSNNDKNDVVDYTVQPGDTIQSVANAYKLSATTIAWANDLTVSSALKTGQSLVILPTDGVLHIVKSGDTISAIASRYKAQVEDIISYNSLANQDDIYIGDILIIPGGTMPKSSTSSVSSSNNNQIPLANNYFIFPTQGKITQGLHYYNAVDVANKCGTPVYAAAAGVVQRAVYNNAWNLGMGNYVTILHSNGTVTYYGHFQNVFVKPGDKVNTGDRIGLMGQTGNATGCHVHFQVMGAKNPLSVYRVGSTISYK
jgi:murein DD-endopeptidase MepM/ murein hydrolase activator NlpD